MPLTLDQLIKDLQEMKRREANGNAEVTISVDESSTPDDERIFSGPQEVQFNDKNDISILCYE